MEGLADELDAPDVHQVAEMVLSGKGEFDADLPGWALHRFAEALREALLDALKALAAPVLAALLLKLLLSRQDAALTLLCRLACVLALAQRYAVTMGIAAAAMGTARRVAEAVAPVLAAALTVTGSGGSAAMLTPLSTLCVGIIEGALTDFGLPLCTLAAIVAAGGGLSDHFRLDRLFSLICRAAIVGVRLMIAGFVCLMAVQGRLAAAQDSASTHAVQQALRSMIPFIGGSVSDTSGALVECALAVRNAVGITGALLAVGGCFRPALRLAVHMLSLKLASAAIEPLADPGVAGIVSAFGDVARLLLALCVGAMLLAALLSGACLGLVGFGQVS